MTKAAKVNVGVKKMKRKPTKTRKTAHMNKKQKKTKTKKRRTKQRKMGGGSLVGTDLITGTNTSNTNDVFAFGTTGGSEYMTSSIMGEPLESNLITASQNKMVPMV